MIVNGLNGETAYTFADKTIHFTAASVNLKDHYWTPIGTSTEQFKGSFKGNGVVIEGLFIGTSSSALDHQALFGFLNSPSTIRASVSGINIASDAMIYGKSRVGGVVGSSAEGIVTECSNAGSVSGTDRVGGIVGYSSTPETIDYCYNTGSVSGTDRVGGIVGSQWGGNVSYCYNTGDVSGKDHVGGISGENYLRTIDYCYNTGSVSGTGDYVGGIAGYNTGFPTHCYNTGDVSGKGYVGGIAGYQSAGDTKGLTNCYNTGSVSGTGNNVGGIVGQKIGLIDYCYNTGSVSGGNYVGGIAGYDHSTGNISYCYNRGDVSGTNSDSIAGRIALGTTIIACFTLDSIPSISATSLTLEKMTGAQAAISMSLGAEWVTRNNAGEMYFFPQLAVFEGSDNPTFVEDSLNSVIFGSKTEEPVITQSEPYHFTVGQKLSDIDPKLYVTVSPSMEGTFSWEDPDRVLNTVGDFTAKIIFTPDDLFASNSASIDANITVTVPEPGPGPGPDPGPGPEPEPGPDPEPKSIDINYYRGILIIVIVVIISAILYEQYRKS